MNTGTWIVIGLIVFVIFSLYNKNANMMKYRRLYDEALKNKDKQKAIQYGRLYHKYRTNSSAKHSTNAELLISNDLKAAGIE